MSDITQKDKTQILKRTLNGQIGLKEVLFVFEKIKKINEVLYKLTDIVSDREPLKWLLRKSSAELVNVFLNQDYLSEKIKDNLLLKAKEKLNKISNLSEISSKNRILAESHRQIIKEEVDKLVSLIDKLLSDITKKYLADVLSIPAINFGPENISVSDRSAVSDKLNRTNMSGRTNRMTNKTELSLRQKKIIEIIKKIGQAGINDISKEIRGCGEKTIQRELVFLCSLGVLGKNGEKRWSRYFYIEKTGDLTPESN